MAVTQINQTSEQFHESCVATLHNPVWGLDVCGETSPAFITWLGGGQFIRREPARIAGRDSKHTICQRHGGGLQSGCLDRLGRGWEGTEGRGAAILQKLDILKYDFSFKFLFVNIQLQETQHGNQPYNTLNLLKTVAKSLHTCDRGLGSCV